MVSKVVVAAVTRWRGSCEGRFCILLLNRIWIRLRFFSMKNPGSEFWEKWAPNSGKYKIRILENRDPKLKNLVPAFLQHPGQNNKNSQSLILEMLMFKFWINWYPNFEKSEPSILKNLGLHFGNFDAWFLKNPLHFFLKIFLPSPWEIFKIF